MLRWSPIDPLVWLTRSLIVQRILQSRWFLLTWRFVLEPGALSALVWWVLPRSTIRHWPTETTAAVSLFLAVNLLLNSRVGRNLQEMAADSLVQGWHDYGVRLLAGAFHAVIDFFRAILEWTERGLYTVDEWLRFKSGESRLSLAVKATLRLVWFWVTYFVRFAVNVLIEPQFNPIKHFPVVTVSHKLLLAAYIPFADFLADLLNIPKWTRHSVAAVIIWCIPGVFGFLAWELRENWRLYAANRPNRLRRVIVGSHGESMLRLLRPGFHSGTIPKRFAKLRRAERKAREKGDWKAARKHLEVLHHVQRDVRRFVEREFAAWFAESRSWQWAVPAVQKVRLATDRVRVAIECPAVSDGTLWLTFEAQSGWRSRASAIEFAERSLRNNGKSWPTPCGSLQDGRRGPGSPAGRRRTPPALVSCHCDNLGLVLWPDEPLETEVRYDLRHDGTQAVPVVSGERTGPVPVFPALDRARLVFRETVIPWQDWVATWETERADGSEPIAPVVPVRPVLSDRQASFRRKRRMSLSDPLGRPYPSRHNAWLPLALSLG